MRCNPSFAIFQIYSKQKCGKQHRGESAFRIILPMSSKYVSVFFHPRTSVPGLSFLDGFLVPHSAIPLHTALSHGLEEKQNCIPLFARQTPQKIPSLWIQFWNRKSCKSRKFFSVFVTFVGVHKNYHKNLWIFACNSREKIYIFLKKAFSFS